ncbi:MAG: cupin domain-containing protein [Thermodesulfobacteria bacterium]|nr:cupin domain-containing protein [Thermodesulfobacteriota bacterium]
MVISEYEKVKPYITKDGSLIRELMHPSVHGNKNLSLAEAIVPVGFTTFLHKHHLSEEVYYILEGKGLMRVGEEELEVKSGDAIYIPPNTLHQIKNIGDIPLRFLCCCAPAYSHEDTEVLES